MAIKASARWNVKNNQGSLLTRTSNGLTYTWKEFMTFLHLPSYFLLWIQREYLDCLQVYPGAAKVKITMMNMQLRPLRNDENTSQEPCLPQIGCHWEWLKMFELHGHSWPAARLNKQLFVKYEVWWQDNKYNFQKNNIYVVNYNASWSLFWKYMIRVGKDRECCSFVNLYTDWLEVHSNTNESHENFGSKFYILGVKITRKRDHETKYPLINEEFEGYCDKILK